MDQAMQDLSFFVVDEMEESQILLLKEAIERVVAIRSWPLDPPRFVNEDVSEDGNELRCIGGILKLHSAHGTAAAHIPENLDRDELEQVDLIVKEMKTFTRETGLEMEFELNGIYVGTVKDGREDRTMAEGFLGPWADHVRQQT